MLTVQRWTRFGEDRLYVTTEDGQRVGWLDLGTGQPTPTPRPSLPPPRTTTTTSATGEWHST